MRSAEVVRSCPDLQYPQVDKKMAHKPSSFGGVCGNLNFKTPGGKSTSTNPLACYILSFKCLETNNAREKCVRICAMYQCKGRKTNQVSRSRVIGPYCFLCLLASRLPLHPRKLTCPPKRSHFKRKVVFQHLPTINFQGTCSISGE